MEKQNLTKRGKEIKRLDLIGNNWNCGKVPWNKGLTKEDPRVMKYIQKLTGIKRSDKFKLNVSNSCKGRAPWNKNLKGEEYTKHFKNGAQSFARHQLKGKTFEEIYGPEKAKEQKLSRAKTIKQYYINGTATFGFPTDGTMKIRRMSQILPKEDTKIEKKIQMFLYNLKLEFYTHQYIHIRHGYQCDISIPVQEGIIQKTIIECDGDWWHGNTEIHPNLTEAQRCQREEDYVRTKELVEQGFRVIRLWESEIKNLDLTIFKNKIRLPIQ